MGRREITGASSMSGTGGVTTVLPDGNRRIKFPAGVVPRTLADSEPTRSGGGRRADLARRRRRSFVLDKLESSRFLLLALRSEELGWSSATAGVGDDSFAATAVRSGKSPFSAGGGSALIAAWLVSESFVSVAVRLGKSTGGDSLFSAGGSSAVLGAWLVLDGPSAGTGGSAIRLLAANWGEEESLSAVNDVAGGDAVCVGDC